MPKKLTKESFILKAKSVHGNRYIYNEVVFTDTKTDVIITCRLHGNFKQRPSHHYSGSGCKKCNAVAAARKWRKTTPVFVTQAQNVHNNKYIYNKAVYQTSKTKVIIICPDHGDFEQTPHNHLQGAGCHTCGEQVESMSNEKFIRKANIVHSSYYSYLADYTLSRNEVTVICPKHGKFKQIANYHLQGCGCPKCATSGFKYHKPAMLYYFKITDGLNIAWKIGVTNNSIKDRYSIQEQSRMSEIISVWFTSGREAYNKEQQILKEYKMHQYKGTPLLKEGNTELFTINIFKGKEPKWAKEARKSLAL